MQNPPTVNRPLAHLLERVDDKELILPEIQRDFVWPKRSVMLLFDSLFRGLPVGHMLVWKAKRLVPSKPFQHRKFQGIRFDNFYGYLLDGQQRLTALARVRDADDEYPLMFYTWPNREGDEDDAFVWPTQWSKSNPWYIPVADVLQGRFDLLGYLRTIKRDEDYEPAFEQRIHADLVKLKGLLDYNVGVIEFDTDDYREATELFIRFNSTGKRLSRSDLFLAELAVQVPELATKNIRRVAQKWPNFGLTMPFPDPVPSRGLQWTSQNEGEKGVEGVQPKRN